MTEKRFVLPFQILLLLITGFFIPPLILLWIVQTYNFLRGKTTMERFGKVGHDPDQETRMINSGIRNDAQVFRQSASRSVSFAKN